MSETTLTKANSGATKPTEAVSAWFRPSYRLGTLIAGLALLGLVMVASSEGNTSPDADFASVLLRRLAWLSVGSVAFVLGCAMNYQWWRRHSLPLFGLTLALLVAVLIPGIGSEINGARRWIRIGHSLGFQPSEFAKVALIIWLAAWCERQITIRSSKSGTSQIKAFVPGFCVPIVVGGTTAALVLGEPDFGTACLIGALTLTVLLLSGTRVIYIILLTASCLPLIQHLVLGSEYRMRRITGFLHPWENARGTGYQLVQSLIGTGSGGIFGKGLGAGAMGFLPAARNDFIFSTIAEQFGFLGAVAIIGAFLWFMWDGFAVAINSRSVFGTILATGITALIGLQAIIHIAVVTGCVPTKGLSLPFVSAGGSSLFVTLWASGILVNIARSQETPEEFELRPWQQDLPDYETKLTGALRQTATTVSKKFRK
ncbi:MAG: FtsW/RodA/SpoVE family cell cycle protein [Candidatus Brocadiia bacterium]